MESPDKVCDLNELEDGACPTSSCSSSTSGSFSDDSSEKTLPLGSVEEAFMQAGLNLTTVAELTEAVEKCKGMVLNTKEYSEERKWLVRYLIELRLRLEEAREANAEQRKIDPIGTPELSPSKASSGQSEANVTRKREKRILLGHHFVLQAPDYTVLRCDRCCTKIWGILHLWYQCTDCRFTCHMRCLEKIKRQCAYVQVCETPFYSNDICPEVGLVAQNYRCSECQTFISFKNCWSEPRQCDYDGRFYCNKCHWNSTLVIPARVVHNWDFTEKKVCCNCYSFLRLMATRPIINLDLLNPQLFQFVESLASIKKLRSQYLLIKQYLTTCQSGLKEKIRKKLLWSLNPHMSESLTGLFCLQDLIDVNKCTLLPILQEVASTSIEHIRGCLICKEKGYYCELCPPPKEAQEDDDVLTIEKQLANEILFPFDDTTYVYMCAKCKAVFHRACWVKKTVDSCPRCERLQERRTLIHENSELSD